MKQKLLLFVVFLCSAFSAQAIEWTGETLQEDGGYYYLYNVEASVFLNSNGSVGTAPVDQWYFKKIANGTYRIYAKKLNDVLGPSDENSGYNYIWLDISKDGLSVNYVDAYSKDTWTSNYEGASTELTMISGTTNNYPSYQFYYERTWTGGRGNAFLAADENGIKAVKGSRFWGNISCDDASTKWYLVKKDTYDEVEKETYYYNIETSASFSDVTTSVSFDDGVENWFDSHFSCQMEFPKGENVNVSIPIYAKASPKEFYRVTGWKDAVSGEIVANGNPGLVSVPFSRNNTDKVSVIAQYTQIFTDAPADGQYALYNPEFDVYMTNAGGNVSVTSDFNKANIYTIKNDTYKPWIGDEFDYTTITLDKTYVGQSSGSARNDDTQWIVEKRGEGYTLNAHNTDRYITASKSAISFSIRYNSSSEDKWAASTWMFITEDHLNSIISNNTAVLAVNATVGYGTFVAPFDVELPTGVTAYKVTGFENNGYTLILTQADQDGVLPANTAVVLQSQSTTDIVETVTGTNASGYDNANSGDYLVGTYEKTAVPTGSYLLQRQNEKTAFYLVDGNNGTLYSGKNRAYLTNVPEGSNGNVKAFSLNGSETTIDEIIVVDKEDTAIYDLSGRRLSQKPARGIYIQNGKKILVK